MNELEAPKAFEGARLSEARGLPGAALTIGISACSPWLTQPPARCTETSHRPTSPGARELHFASHRCTSPQCPSQSTMASSQRPILDLRFGARLRDRRDEARGWHAFW